MKNRARLALIVSLFVLVGFPFGFFFVSMFTGEWLYFLWSFPPSIVAGIVGFIVTLQERKKNQNG